MKAAVHTSCGPPDVVSVIDVETPTPADDELLVRVRATTVNRTDCAYRAAHPFFVRLGTGPVRPRATVLGNEFAGEVAAIGGGVSSFAVGDRVFGYVEGPFGAHAEYLTQDASVATMPTDVAFEEAAASTEGYPLDDIVEAYRYVEAGQKVGNVVITVDPGDGPPR